MLFRYFKKRGVFLMGWKTRPVNMRIPESILKKLNDIKKWVHKKNRTQAVIVSVGIAETIMKAVTNGGKIYIEHSDGSKEYVKFIF